MLPIDYNSYYYCCYCIAIKTKVCTRSMVSGKYHIHIYEHNNIIGNAQIAIDYI